MNKLELFQRLPFQLKNILASIYGYRLTKKRTYNRDKFLSVLQGRESWSLQKYMDWQKEAVRNLLLYSVDKVPYYRDWWLNKDHSLVEDIRNWPVLEKEVVRNHPELFISDDYQIQNLHVMHTSGTTGKPMTIYLSKECMGLWYALYDQRIKKHNGVDPQKEIYGTFAGQLICTTNQKKPPFWVYNKFNKQVYFSSYHINPENVESYIRAILNYKLTYLMGYTSSIYNLAKLALDQNLKLPALKLIITNAEPLYNHQRELLSSAFQCPVVQTYSGCEFSFGGSEDLGQLMWLWPESGLLEVLKEDGTIKGHGAGEFLATGLVNQAMPLIRYRVGDTGEVSDLEEVPSGRNKLFLKKIEGRTDDLIRTPDGKIIGRLDPVFKSDFQILEAQIIQYEIDQLKLLVVESSGFSNDQRKELVQRLKDRVGPLMKIKYQAVDQIQRGPNGKFKAVISKITSKQPKRLQ